MRAMILATVLVAAPLAAQAPAYTPATDGVREAALGALHLRVLVDAATLGGGEVEVVEITFPPGAGARGGAHRHGRVELLYVLAGELEHVVNGEPHRLTVGMVGIVRPGDTVVHRVVSPVPVRALVIWAPGGELARVAP